MGVRFLKAKALHHQIAHHVLHLPAGLSNCNPDSIPNEALHLAFDDRDPTKRNGDEEEV